MELPRKTVIIMYPDSRTTGGDPVLTRDIPLTQLVGQFIHTTQRILHRYQRQGYERVAIVHADTSPLTFSILYPLEEFDQIIPLGKPISDWDRASYKSDLVQYVTQLGYPPRSKFIVGGYHTKDCVVEMIRVLRNFGYEATPNLALTDTLGKVLLLSHKERKLQGAPYNHDGRVWDVLLYQQIKQEVDNLINA